MERIGRGAPAVAGLENAKAARPAQAHGDLRCGCGSLLARVVHGEVELKCRRCKRTWRIPLGEG